MIIIDVDLQDPVSLIPQLYNKIKDSDYECIYARRLSEWETLLEKPLLVFIIF